jgi:ribose transport system ATP-binding protein
MQSPQTVVSVKNVRIQFGAVKALDGVDLDITSGEVVGLIGHNGAGKSTIVNVINGALAPHQGTVSYERSEKLSGIAAARANGIRCAFQELSLCPNLTVAENTRLMHAGLNGFNWRKRAGQLFRQNMDEIFPGNHVAADDLVGELSIAERQMVEIAINFMTAGEKPRLVILDEPTSSLDAGLAEQLLAYVRRFVSGGGSVILISHILSEILSTANRIVVMKDGKIAASKPASEFTVRSLVETMGSVVKEKSHCEGKNDLSEAQIAIALPQQQSGSIPFNARKGEIVGLAGLAGHGQTEMLLDLYRQSTSNWLPTRENKIAFVAGDRSLNGTFALWSILRNLTIGNLLALTRLGTVDGQREAALGEDWKKRISIKTPDTDLSILSLSGGNQQKVLFARALSLAAPIVLMDDPMRGVDIGTKQEVYKILRDEAAKGCTFVWYSTEMDEICLCDRVYVFRDGAIAAELSGDRISEESILEASFTGGNL